MAKPFHEFGGWLRFFQINTILSLVIGILVMIVILMAALVNFSYRDFMETLVVFADVGVSLYFMARILIVVQKREAAVPRQIKGFLLWYMVFSLLFLAIEIPVTIWANHGGWNREDTLSARASLQTIVYFLIWKTYFDRSRRVAEYYHPQEIVPENLPDHYENDGLKPTEL